MACRSVLRSVILTDSWRPFHHSQNYKPSNSRLNGDLFVTIRAPNFNFARTIHHVKCSHSDTISSEDNQGPPHEVILKAISEVSKTEGRVGQTTNMVIGGTVTDDATNEWRSLDKKVNTYPTVREFTAIGTGGDDFVHAMVGIVEKVLHEPIPEGCVKQKLSSGGKYVSVNIGPVQVISFEQSYEHRSRWCECVTLRLPVPAFLSLSRGFYNLRLMGEKAEEQQKNMENQSNVRCVTHDEYIIYINTDNVADEPMFINKHRGSDGLDSNLLVLRH